MAWSDMDTSELQGESYVRALNGAKIALAFFSSWNLDTYTTRVFEIPACGTMLLSQRTETMLTLYSEDTEAVYFDSIDELVDKARYYLKHDSVRRRVALAGHRRCISSGYDIYSRMQEWISVAKMSKKLEDC
jgi:spore maturation protein CgeB